MFARPAAPEPSRRIASYAGSPAPGRTHGINSKLHRHRAEQPRDSPRRHAASMPHREARRSQMRDWHDTSDKPCHSAGQHADPNVAEPHANVSTPRAVKAPQTTAAPGPGSMGRSNAVHVSLGSGAFHPGVPSGLPAYFRTNGQAHESSDAHSGHWQPAASQQPLRANSNTRDGPDMTPATAFSKPTEGMPLPRPKSLRRSANHVYIAHMIVEWQRELTRYKQPKPFQPPPSSVPASSSNPNARPNPGSSSNPKPMPYTASAFAADSTLQPSNSNHTVLSQPAQSSPSVPVKQEQPQPAPMPQHSMHIPQSMQSAQPPAPMPATSSNAIQFAQPPFNLGVMRPPPQPPQGIGPRDASGNVIPPMQYYKNMLGPQKFEALQPRLPLLQPGTSATPQNML